MAEVDNETALWDNNTWSNATVTPSEKIDLTLIRTTYFVGMGIIIPIGFIFNTLAIVVLASSRTLRNSTTGLYLVALSIADNLFLSGEFLKWLDNKRLLYYAFQSMSLSTCHFMHSLRYGAKLTSAWITVAITAERFFIITFPLKAGVVCVKRLAIILICVICIVCFVLGCFPTLSLHIRELNHDKDTLACLIDDHYIYEIGNWVVLRVGSLILPGVVITILTMLIIINLSRAKMMRKRTLNEDRPVTCTGGRRRSRSLEKQLTAMLLSVAIAFIVLRLPYTILYYINEYKEEMWIPLDSFFSYQIYVATKVSELFAVANYAVNFFLYCLTGSTFRSQLAVLFCCKDVASLNNRRTSTSAATRSTIVGNDKIALSVMKKSQNGRGPQAKYLDSQENLTESLNKGSVPSTNETE